MTDFIDDLVAKIDLELARTTAEIEQLRQGRQALINGSEPAPAPRPAPAPTLAVPPTPKPRSAANRRRRSAAQPAAVVPAGKLVAVLSASGGLSSAALANATGGALAQIRELLKALEQDGQVRRDGHARGLRWFAVSEEERVAQRAAEIEARVRQPKRERPHLARVRARRS